jgi:hypothetical protein
MNLCLMEARGAEHFASTVHLTCTTSNVDPLAEIFVYAYVMFFTSDRL